MALDILGGLFELERDKKFLLRDFRNASQLVPGVNPPRQKFEGYVNFILNRDLYQFLYGESNQDNNFKKEISSLVRTADLPSVVFQTETKNAYNRKKIVNTGVTYNPVGITVFDTVGNEWLTTLMKYFSYHFMDPRNLQEGTSRDIAGNQTRERTEFDSNAAGYNLNASAQFFERIDYVLYHGRRGVQYSIINPVMTNFKPGTIDYSSSELQEFSMEFEYERFTVFNELNFRLDGTDDERFEDTKQIKFDSTVVGEDGEDDKSHLPTVMQEPRTLKILGGSGSDELRRDRSNQPVVTISEETGDAGIPVAPPVAPEATYSATYDSKRMNRSHLKGDDDYKEPNFLSDILGDVADSALSAVLRGQNVRDAIIGTAVAGASTALGEEIFKANQEVADEDAIKTGDE